MLEVQLLSGWSTQSRERFQTLGPRRAFEGSRDVGDEPAWFIIGLRHNDWTTLKRRWEYQHQSSTHGDNTITTRRLPRGWSYCGQVPDRWMGVTSCQVILDGWLLMLNMLLQTCLYYLYAHMPSDVHREAHWSGNPRSG